MNRRLIVVGALILAVVLLAGCEGYENYTPSAYDLTRIAVEVPEGPTKDMIQGTAVARYVEAEMARLDAQAAQATADTANRRHQEQVVAMTSEAQAVERARADAAQATRQALDAQERQNAINATATAAAIALQATVVAETAQARQMATIEAQQATATAEIRNANATSTAVAETRTAEIATAQAVALQATATVQAQYDQATRVSLAATQEIERLALQRERVLHPLKIAGAVLLVLACAALAGWAIWRFLQVAEDRARVLQPRLDKGEPILVWRERFGLPLRAFNVIVDAEKGAERSPLLAPSAQFQEGTTGRQQTANLAQAVQVADTVRARHKPLPATINVFTQNGDGNGRGAALQQGDNGAQWEVEPAEVRWPSRVPLRGILDGAPSYRRLALGVTMNGDGRAEIVRGDMTRMVHVAVGGSSGWGKSVFLQSLAYQMALSTDRVDMAMVDLEGVTFAPFAHCPRLLYPVADNERDTLAILQALTQELDHRRELYARYPGVADLDGYNARAGDPLAPIVVLFDEATALLDDKAVEGAIKTLTLRARKYGLWVVLGGQDWKASSLDTAIRNQLASRVQFRAMSASQSRVLLQQNGAETLDVPGRALAILPGRELMKLQAPLVNDGMLARLGDGGPRSELPDVAQGDGGQTQEILDLAADGLSRREIESRVFGYSGGAAHRRVAEVLGATTTA